MDANWSKVGGSCETSQAETESIIRTSSRIESRHGLPSFSYAVKGILVLVVTLLFCNIDPTTPLELELGGIFTQSGLTNFGLPSRFDPFHNITPDAYVDPPEFIVSRGFEAETHEVVTKDNYIVTMHRIINPLVPQHLRHQLKPVLLQHGLFTSSYNFIINGDEGHAKPKFDPADLKRTRPLYVYRPDPPLSMRRILETLNDLTLARFGLTEYSDRLAAPELSDSIGFEMANEGYDVWMANSRGSTYSLKHKTLDHRIDWKYWDFSFHEIGLYDLPAQIDYILKKRQRKSLGYIGHSQGNMVMFILQSYKPEWARKVKPFIALAPIAFIPDVYFGILRMVLNAISPFLTPTSLNRVLKGEAFPKSDLLNAAFDFVCRPKLTTIFCDLGLTALLGNNLKRTNQSLTPILTHHIPEGTSVLNLLHFGQLVKTGEFRTFDFGPEENVRRYGKKKNPRYKIENIKSRDIAFVSGRTDTLSTIKNVALTRSMLKVPLIDDYVVPDPIWGHADYMYAIGAGRQANAHMIGLVDRYRLVD